MKNLQQWPEYTESILEKIFNDRLKQFEDEIELEKILEPLPDKLFEID